MKEIFYQITLISYFITCLVFVFYLVITEKSKNRIIDSAILFWFLTFNLYKSLVVWRVIPKLWYLRKADFMLGVFLIILFILSLLSNFKSNDKNKLENSKSPQLRYEMYFYLYIIFSVFLYGLHYHLDDISYFKATSFSRLYLDAFLIYFTFKKFVTIELLRMFLRAIIFLGVISAIVSIIQFFIDTKFLRIGYFHFAFPGHNRSSGLFYYPYDNGLYQILATYTVAYYYKDRLLLKTVLISLFIFALILDFTRGTWIAFLVISIFHLYFYYKKTFRRILLVGGLLTLIFSLSYGIFQYNVTSGGYVERITSDTVTVRMAFYGFVIKAIPERWLIGYGDVENNKVYFKGMANADQTLQWALGRIGGIHNMFLEEAFLRGIFSPILMIIFFFSFSIYSIKMSLKENNYFYCIPNYFVIGFFIYFNSVAGFFMTRSGFLTVMLFAFVAGIHYKKIDISELLPKRDLKAFME